MRLLSFLRRLLRRGDRRRPGRGTSVPVEREPAAEVERAVAEPAPSEAEPADPAAVGATEAPVDTIDGIGPAYAERLAAAGVETVGDLAAADPADLADRTGLGEGRLSGWIERANAA